MAIDLNAFPPNVKLALIAVGEEFSSDDTFAQATRTHQGLEKYAGILRLYGLPLSDGQCLEEARELLSAAGCGRNQAKSQKMTLGIGLDEANKLDKLYASRAGGAKKEAAPAPAAPAAPAKPTETP